MAGGAASPLIAAIDSRRGSDSRSAIACDRSSAPAISYRLAAPSRSPTRSGSIASSPRWPATAHVPLVATNDVCHSGAERALLDVLTCIRLKTTLGRGRAARFGSTTSVISSPRAIWSRCFAISLTRVAATRAVAERCDFTLKDLGYRFPIIRFRPAKRSTVTCARSLTPARGERWGPPLSDRVRRQLEHELAIIAKLGLAGYFLIVWDIVQVLPRESHPRPGTRLGRQQRGLLRARHHRRRRGRDGSAVRALPVRGARRMARYRYRFAQRRPARESDSILVSSATASAAPR